MRLRLSTTGGRLEERSRAARSNGMKPAIAPSQPAGRHLQRHDTGQCYKGQRCIDETCCCRLHVEHELPPRLVDRYSESLRSLRLDQPVWRADPKRWPCQRHLTGYLPGLMTELPHWPEAKAITLKDPLPTAERGDLWQLDATPADTLTVTQEEFQTGRLKPGCWSFWTNRKPKRCSAERSPPTKRTPSGIARSIGDAGGQTHFAGVRVAVQNLGCLRRFSRARLQSDYPDLPCSVIEQCSRMPIRRMCGSSKRAGSCPQAASATACSGRKVRLNRAFEGLYLEKLDNADSRRLACARWRPCRAGRRMCASKSVAVFTGQLEASVGAPEAPIRKVLIADEDGLYSARDEQGCICTAPRISTALCCMRCPMHSVRHWVTKSFRENGSRRRFSVRR